MGKRKRRKKKPVTKKPITINKKRIVSILALLILIILLVGLLSFDAGEKDYTDFLNALGWRESTGRYHAKNRYGYLGRYQMGEAALQEAGFLDENGSWTALASEFGIHSEEDFLNSQEGQEAAIRACHRKLCAYIRHYGLDNYIGTRYCGVIVTRSGLLAACHLVGARGMKQALQENAMAYDGNRVPASEYMRLFAGYNISEVWNENP